MPEPLADGRLCPFINEYVSIFRWQCTFRQKNIPLNLHYVLFVQESIESAATSAALKAWRLTSRASSDVILFGESQDRIRALERDVTTLKGHLNVAKSKEKSAIDAEAFILDCLNATNQQMESKISFCFPLLCSL